jgi:hypothetical protein
MSKTGKPLCFRIIIAIQRFRVRNALFNNRR